MLRSRRRILLATVTTLVLLSLGLSSCSSPIPRRDPTGEVFPSVVGQALSGESVRIPEDFAGRPIVLLVGYKQSTQFDLDRWLLGLSQAEVPVDVREIPTIAGLVPGMIGGWIDGGMRRGIPSEDWGSVVTVYRGASAIQEFTGTENPMPGRILLLDPSGEVIWFHDRGYSVGSLNRLREALDASAE
ncbi:MAG: hypothetical protein ACO4B4_09105 [Planctomycetota bacterium]|jgi:hypothetical protein